MMERPTIAERLAGPERCAKLLDGSDDMAQRFEWYGFVREAVDSGQDDLLRQAFAAWHRVVDDDRVLAWWQERRALKPALPRQLLVDHLVGVMRVELTPGDDWQETPDPQVGFAAIAWCWLDIFRERALDLLVMNPNDPRSWRRRIGQLTILPRDDAVMIRLQEGGARLRLFENPLDWLAAGCQAGSICVLDWDGNAAQELIHAIDRGDAAVICDSHAHGRNIARRVRPRRPALRITAVRQAPLAAE